MAGSVLILLGKSFGEYLRGFVEPCLEIIPLA
jgi:hypothetical protein